MSKSDGAGRFRVDNLFLREYNLYMKILREITPKSLMCGIGACPAIFETTKGSYVLVGKRVDAKKVGIANRVSKDEFVIEVPRDLIDKKLV